MDHISKHGVAATQLPTKTPEPVCWINGSLVPRAQARVSVFDHGLLYGDGVFEGIRFYNGRPFRLARHVSRLNASAAAIRLAIPYDAETLDSAVRETIAAFG